MILQDNKSYKIYGRVERIMQNSLWMKGLVVGIIGLFIGTSFTITPTMFIKNVKADPSPAYIIIHAHNPEGIELGSIARSGDYLEIDSVKIYANDTFIGYGAYDYITHNQSIAISPGIYIIKVTFNGMKQEKTVNLQEGKTEVLTFTFNRTEISNTDIFVGSYTFDFIDYFDIPTGVYDFSACDNEINSFLWITNQSFYFWRNNSLGSVTLEIHKTGNYQLTLNNITFSYLRTFKMYPLMFNREIFYNYGPITVLALKNINIPITNNFTYWFYQQNSSVLKDRDWFIWIPYLYGYWYFAIKEPGYFSQKILANVSYYIMTELFVDEGQVRIYKPPFYAEFPRNRTLTYAGNDIKFSSVPYDLGGEGVKETPGDISVGMNYYRDLSRYKIEAILNLKVPPPTDSKTIYGGDTIFFTINASNKLSNNVNGIIVNDLLPNNLQFIYYTSTQGDYDNKSGIWNVGYLAGGATATLNITAKVLKDGAIENSAILSKPSNDANPSNNQATINITAKPPVIFVHGWRGSKQTWIDFRKNFITAGIKYFVYDYSPAVTDPYNQSFNFTDWINTKIRSQNQNNYQGRFDIICHSMGALVSRFYIEANSANARNVRKWVGIAPVNHGAAIADFESTIPSQVKLILTPFFPDLNKNTGAIVHMRTDDSETLSIENNTFGKNAGIAYYVIMGELGTKQNITPIDVSLLKFIWHQIKQALGDKQTIVKIADKQYGLTWQGDLVVANKQSVLNCSTNYDPFLGLDHNQIVNNPSVIDIAKQILNQNI